MIYDEENEKFLEFYKKVKKTNENDNEIQKSSIDKQVFWVIGKY